jgi:hypothetical protein
MPKSISYPLRALKLPVLFLLFAFATACQDDDDNGPPPAASPALIDFGAQYLVNESAEYNGVSLPVLVGDSLVLGLFYSGCAPGHTFELRSRVLSAQRAEVWIYKLTPDEACQAVFFPTHSFRIPFDVLAREDIVLVSPQLINFPLR